MKVYLFWMIYAMILIFTLIRFIELLDEWFYVRGWKRKGEVEDEF